MQILIDEQDYCEAADFLQPELTGRAGQARSWLSICLAMVQRGEYGRARVALERAADIAALDPASACILAECYLQTGRRTLAIDLLCTVADSAGCSTDLLPSIAAGLGRAGDDQAAFEVCRLAADRQPDWPEPLFGMAFYLRKLGNSAQAVIPLVTKACELSPGQSLYLRTLAFLLAQDDRAEEAWELLQEIPLEQFGAPCEMRPIMDMFRCRGDCRRGPMVRLRRRTCIKRLTAPGYRSTELVFDHMNFNKDANLMHRILLSALLLLAIASSAAAHFVFVVPLRAAAKRTSFSVKI